MSFDLFYLGPLVNLRRAVNTLQSELTLMDVRLGVVQQSLLQARLRDRAPFIDKKLAAAANVPPLRSLGIY